MFGGLMSARLKAAENALRDGRIDEAFRLATAPDLIEQHRAGAVLTGLTDKFIERARIHFRAERFAEASADLDRAELGGTKSEEIAELRRHIGTVAAEVMRQEASRKERIEAAKRRVEAGSLAAGRNILEGASESDPQAQRLHQSIEQRANEVRDLLGHVEGLLAQGQIARAAERLLAAKRLDAHAAKVSAMETKMCETVLGRARAALKEGRPAKAAAELKSLGALGGSSVPRRELADMLAKARAAGDALLAHNYANARQQMLALGRLLPGIKWIDKAVEQLRQIDDIGTALRAGPLGERLDSHPGRVGQDERSETRRPHAGGLDETIAVPTLADPDDSLPQRLLLLVNGGGSYLLLRGDRISIGRAASQQPADVAIFSDLAERHAHISKVDEDYFLFAGKDVEVGGRRTKHQLLRDGDRVVLARRAKFGFRLPSRKSLSAVLDLSDTTKMPNDVRRVILFDRHATIGVGHNSHIRCTTALQTLVLFERDGALWIRPRSDGRGRVDAQRVKMGAPIEMAGMSFVVEPWQVRSFGVSRI